MKVVPLFPELRQPWCCAWSPRTSRPPSILKWPETTLLDSIASWPPVLHTVAAARKALTYFMFGAFHEKGQMLELEASTLADLGMFRRYVIMGCNTVAVSYVRVGTSSP